MKEAMFPLTPLWRWISGGVILCLLAAGAWLVFGDSPVIPNKEEVREPAHTVRRPSPRSELGETSASEVGPMVTGRVRMDGFRDGLPFVAVEDIPGDPHKKYYKVAVKYFKWFPKDSAEGETLVNVPAALDEVEFEVQSAQYPPFEVARNHDLIARNTEFLNSIILPSIQFQEATVAEAVEYLRQQSIGMDPNGDGVGFVNHFQEPGTPALEMASGQQNIGLDDFGTPSSGKGNEIGHKRITLRLTSVPLLVALKYVTDLAGLTYRVEEHAVVIMPYASGDDMVRLHTREFLVAPGVFSRAQDSESRGFESSATPRHAKDILMAAGVSFDIPGSSATFLPASSKLVVRNTARNLDLIEAILGCTPDATLDATSSYLKKLNAIIIPSVQFQDATVAECLEYLSQQVVRLNPHQDPNFGLVTNDASAPAHADIEQKRVTLRLTNVPLGVTTRYIADVADLDIRVELHNGVEQVDFVAR